MAALRKIRMLPAAFMIILLSGTAATVCGAGSNAALTLKDCIGTAIEKSPLIRASALDVQAAQASLRGSKGALFPRLDLSGLYMKENQSVPYIPAEGVTIPARFNIIRSAESLKEALAGLEHLEHEIIPKVEVRDYHKLMNYHELLGMLTTANLTYRCALLREESRGSHYREDFPHRDNQNWLKWTRSKCLNGDIRVETVPAPVEKYKLYSIEIPLR